MQVANAFAPEKLPSDGDLRAAVEADRAQFADAFERSPSFMAILRGPEHRFQFANDRYRELVGRRELIGRTVSEALPEVVAQGFLELLHGAYASGEPFVGQDISVRLQREPGGALEERIVDFVYQPTREPDGTISGIFVHGVDMTARKDAEARLRALAQDQGLALEAANMGWWRFDPTTDRLRCDSRARAIYDLPEGDVDLRELLGRVHPDDLPRVSEAIRGAFARPDLPYQIEYRFLRRDGSPRWISSRGRVTDGSVGTPCLVGVTTDATEHRAAEEALRDSETRFRQLADAMPQIVFAATPEGHVDYFNRQWYEYTGIPDGEIGFESWRPVHDPALLPGVVEQWTRCVRDGQPYQIEYPLRRADGEFRWHLGRALPVRDETGAIVRWFGTNTDIDDHKRLQESHLALLESERAARAEAERTGRIKDEFLATLSHELRTPLNAILGWVQVLRAAPPSSPADLDQGLATIERNARAQTQIIEDLLDMSAIISGKVRLEVQRLDLRTVVDAAAETVRPAAQARGVAIHSASGNTPYPVSGDPNRLQQVFWNLLSNAIKFTPRGGRVDLGFKVSPSHIVVRVSDSGSGIAPEFLPHVFDRFRQADASTTRRHGGLGLGLAIVKQLVELHGGSVAVVSPGADQGTTFTVKLPAETSAVSVPASRHGGNPPPAPAPALSPQLMALRFDGLTILVVDDDSDSRAVLQHLLEERGARVLAADSATTALAALEGSRADLLISDIGMPGEDGYSLIRRVRALSPEAGGLVPALALTAYARAQDRTRALLSGFQMHAAKPIEAPELLAMVASLTHRPASA